MEVLGANIDLIHEVAQHLGLHDRLHLAFCNKLCWRSREFFQEGQNKYGTFQLKIEQQDILVKMEATKKRYQILRLPTSFGKTALIWIHLLAGFNPQLPINNLDRVLLIVPTKLVRCCVDELLRLFPQYHDKDPTKTSIVIDDPCRKEHYAITKNRTILPNWKVFVTNSHRLYNHFRRQRTAISDAVFIGQFGTCVIDEAHLEYSAIQNLIYHDIGSLVALSADQVELPVDQEEIEELVVTNEVIAEHVPDYCYRHTKKPIDWFLKTEPYHKLVIFLPSKEHYTEVQAKVPEGIEVYRFASSLDKVKKFHSSPNRAILLTTYKLMAVGHNLLVDHVLLVNPEVTAYNTLYQVISRFLRVTNPHRLVTFHLSTQTPLTLRFRLAATEVRRKHNLEFKDILAYKRIHNGTLEKALEHFQLDPWVLDPLELVWFGCYGTTDKGLNQLFVASGLEEDERGPELRPFYYNTKPRSKAVAKQPPRQLNNDDE